MTRTHSLLFSGSFLFLIGLVITVLRFSRPQTLLSPLGSILSLNTNTTVPKSNRQVFAFLPFWLIDDVADRDLPPFTHLAYFGLEFDGKGNLRVTTADGYKEPGLTHYLKEPFSRLARKVKDRGGKVLLVLRMMQNDDIETALSSPSARQKIIDTTMSTLNQRSFDGINVDIEYTGTPPESTIQNLTSFVKELRSQCQSSTSNPCQLSIDAYADAAKKPRIWDLGSLSPLVDTVIIMGYDFSRPGSIQAGPVAPLRGACPANTLAGLLENLSGRETSHCQYDYDITSSIRDYSQIVPVNKLVLAVPFYGYEWPTVSASPGANTTDRGITASYDRVQATINSLALLGKPYQQAIDPVSLTPYFIYSDGKNVKQIWYDNPVSLRLKRQLVDNAGLAGIAAWAWGYDDETGSLWQAISN